MAVHKIKEKLTLNRPAYIGMCILDLSKTLMHNFHYNYIKKNYGKNAKLLFTDTDSLCYEIETADAYKDFMSTKINLILVTIQKTAHSSITTTRK